MGSNHWRAGLFYKLIKVAAFYRTETALSKIQWIFLSAHISGFTVVGIYSFEICSESFVIVGDDTLTQLFSSEC